VASSLEGVVEGMRLRRDITVLKDGKEYVLRAGTVIDLKDWPGLEKYVQPGYADKLVRHAHAGYN
jgi:hypothetical protein